MLSMERPLDSKNASSSSSAIQRDDYVDPFDSDRRPGLTEITCSEDNPCCDLVNLYARLGIHRYNLLEGKNYEFVRVEKYAYKGILALSPFYITMSSNNLDDLDDDSELSFITTVNEKMRGKLVVTCNIARPRDERCKVPYRVTYLKVSDVKLPEWPPENPFENKERFYVVSKSELQDNEWIRLYLELVVAKTTRQKRMHPPDLSSLEIVNVATSRDPDNGLYSKDATFYISYKDPREARVGTDVDRIAVVRRTFDQETQCFTLFGQNQSLQDILPTEVQNQSLPGILPGKAKEEGSSSVEIDNVATSPRRVKSFKKRGRPGLARRLNKKISV